MADPTTPAATAPAASQPKVKTELEQRYDEAGYARNRAELAYKNAVKEHGKDSSEAKAAHETLTKAQTEVEAIQEKLRPKKVVVVKAAPKVKKEEPAKVEEKVVEFKVELPKFYSEYIEIRPKAAYLYEHSEMLIRHDASKLLNDKTLDDLKKCIKKLKKDENITPCIEKLKPVQPDLRLFQAKNDL